MTSTFDLKIKAEVKIDCWTSSIRYWTHNAGAIYIYVTIFQNWNYFSSSSISSISSNSCSSSSSSSSKLELKI